MGSMGMVLWLSLSRRWHDAIVAQAPGRRSLGGEAGGGGAEAASRAVDVEAEALVGPSEVGGEIVGGAARDAGLKPGEGSGRVSGAGGVLLDEAGEVAANAVNACAEQLFNVHAFARLGGCVAGTPNGQRIGGIGGAGEGGDEDRERLGDTVAAGFVRDGLLLD